MLIEMATLAVLGAIGRTANCNRRDNSATDEHDGKDKEDDDGGIFHLGKGDVCATTKLHRPTSIGHFTRWLLGINATPS